MMTIVLASQSPRRREILARMGVTQFAAIAPEVEEIMDLALSPARIVEALSLQKAHAVAEHAPSDALIIAADTVVTLDGAVLGKPTDAGDAARMLTALSGRTHCVYTGLTVLCGGEIVTEHEATDVTFRPLTSSEIADYTATGEPMDKAGAYGIQGVGASLVTGISGDFYNVMGLPAARLARILTQFGIDVLRMAAGG